MIASEQTNEDSVGYEPIFSYGHLRANYTGSEINNGLLPVSQFVRKEHVAALHEALLLDKDNLATASAMAQRNITPVTRQCLWELQSGIMIRVLENITGLHNLLPDSRCKQSQIALASNATALQLPVQKDPETGLTSALLVLIQLHTGNAYLCTSASKPDCIKSEGDTLCVTYWQHKPDVTDSPL